MEDQLASAINDEAIACLRYGRTKIEHCLEQLDDTQVWWRPSEEMNSIGNLLLHLAGNLRQWIVAGVGTAEDVRRRQEEFDHRDPLPKMEVYGKLAVVLDEAEQTLTNLSASDWLLRKRVQGHDVTKLGAMMHSLTHFQGHVQEIICLTRQQLRDQYRFEWQPKSKEEGA